MLSTRLARRATAALMSVIVSLSVTACVPADTNHLSAVQVENRLVELLTNTAKQLAVGGWDTTGGRPRPSPCDQPDTSKFAWTIATSPGVDALADAQRIRDYWASLGMTARLVERPRPAVYAHGGGNVAGVAFISDRDSYLISGNSLCADGNSADLEDRPRSMAPSESTSLFPSSRHQAGHVGPPRLLLTLGAKV